MSSCSIDTLERRLSNIKSLRLKAERDLQFWKDEETRILYNLNRLRRLAREAEKD